MKMQPHLLKTAILLSVLTCCGHFIGHAQSAKDSKDDKAARKAVFITSLVDSQHYVFIAQSASPMTGRTRQLTSDYSLKVSTDVIISDLPYYGRAYSAPVDPSQLGIQFTSKAFSYTKSSRKKGGWDIVIKLKDSHDVQQMLLTIFENGHASLQVLSNNRQAITFNGSIKAARPSNQ
jgi:hypothetical protein